MFSKCNCGLDGKYSFQDENGDMISSCNKYNVCPTYSKLDIKNKELELALKKSLNCAIDLTNYKQSSEFYKHSVSEINRFYYIYNR